MNLIIGYIEQGKLEKAPASMAIDCVGIGNFSQLQKTQNLGSARNAYNFFRKVGTAQNLVIPLIWCII